MLTYDLRKAARINHIWCFEMKRLINFESLFKHYSGFVKQHFSVVVEELKNVFPFEYLKIKFRVAHLKVDITQWI